MEALTRLLSLDCEVVGTVADGSALLEAAQRLQPDVIVLDVNLPKLSGLDRVRRQITQAHTRASKVIVLTAASDPVMRQASLDAGAFAFVSKLGSVKDLLLRSHQARVGDIFGDGDGSRRVGLSLIPFVPIRGVTACASKLHPVIATALVFAMSGSRVRAGVP